MGKRDLKFQVWENMDNRPLIRLKALSLTHPAAMWSIIPAGSSENSKGRIGGEPKSASSHLGAQTLPSAPNKATLPFHLHRKPLLPHIPGHTAPDFMETSVPDTNTQSQGHKVLPTTDLRAVGVEIMRIWGKGCQWGLWKH